MFHRNLTCTFLALVLVSRPLSLRAAETDAKADSQKAAIVAHLQKAYPGKTWDEGPLLVDTPEVRQAYGARRFYIVLSREPHFPYSGIPRAVDDPALKKYAADSAKFRRDKLSLTLGVDADGTITEYRERADFARGLMKITEEDDCKVAVAAVLTLYIRDEFGYLPVKAKEVRLNPPRLAGGTQGQVEVGGTVAAVNIGAQGQLQGFTRGPRALPPQRRNDLVPGS